MSAGVLSCGLWCRQILASANTAYSIPWPSAFQSFLSVMEVFLVDVISVFRANCATPMTYYDSLVVVLVSFKILLFCVVAGPALYIRLSTLVTSSVGHVVRRASRLVSLRPNAATPREPESVLAVRQHPHGPRRRRTTMLIESTRATVRAVASLDWTKVLRVSFVLLFVAHPGACVGQ